MTNSTRCGALTTVGGRPCRQRTSDETPCKYHGPGTQYAADRARADAAATHAGEARAARLALAPPTPPLPPRTTVNHDPTAPPPERRRDEVWPPIKCEHPLCRATARPGRYTCARHRDDQAALR